MSDQTLEALETAIAAHVASENDEFSNAWVVVVNGQSLESRSDHYGYHTPSTQPFHVTEGLITIGRRLMDDVWDAADDD